MSYVDAYLDREKDQINIVERVKGKRNYVNYPVEYLFYYNDPHGQYKSMLGHRLSRFATKRRKEFQRELKIHSNQKLHESDINPIFRSLEKNYLDVDAPKLHLALFDIEVDFDPKLGFAKPDDPHQPVTGITVYLDWLDSLVTLVIKPKDMPKEEAQSIVERFEDTMLCDSEAQLINTFLDLIKDADVLSGWNSEGFDIPYMVNRTAMVLGKESTNRYCLWNLYPRKREYIKYGNTQETYDLFGRVHLDYLELYRKYTYHEMHSYRLDAIGEYEVGEKKIPYEGTIEQLYNDDFEKFIAYNRQDVEILKKLDKKLRFVDLANELAHANTVLLQTTMGAVAVTEQAIINEAHKRGVVVPDRKRNGKNGNGHNHPAAVGAYVAYPKKGKHEWIGSIDINSLYPSVIRSLNMGPETIIGQLRQDHTTRYISNKINNEKKSAADAWEGIFGSLEYTAVMAKDKGTEITVDFENGQTETMSGAELYEVIFNSGKNWCLSANGTLFRTDIEGIVPGLLESWYAQRKVMQATMREQTDPEERAFWDKRQLVKKINLNSLYGAILNPGCRFFDMRIGQSVTLTGRAITKHMASKTNEVIAGEYDYRGKGIIYGDTDSVYFSAWPMVKEQVENGEIEWTKESVIDLYDTIAEEVNKSFPSFMKKAFQTSQQKGEIIVGGREVVGSSGLFITKKRYAILVYDEEGVRKDAENEGKVKIMGIDIKRSDTPEFMQKFLSTLLRMVLIGGTKEDILQAITLFKEEFTEKPGWEKGTPKRVNNLTMYYNKIDDMNKKVKRQFEKEFTLEMSDGKAQSNKVNLPGHVRASMNWNTLRSAHKDHYSLPINDGQKVIVCKLRDNPMGYTSVAYPIDELNIPSWFKELPFDHEAMEQTIIDQKVSNMIGVMGWDLSKTKTETTVFGNLFEMA